MPKRKTKKVSTHGEFGDMIFRFDVTGEVVLAVHNAVSFALAHRERYLEETENCEQCLQGIESFRRYLAHIIDNAPAYTVEEKKN